MSEVKFFVKTLNPSIYFSQNFIYSYIRFKIKLNTIIDTRRPFVSYTIFRFNTYTLFTSELNFR